MQGQKGIGARVARERQQKKKKKKVGGTEEGVSIKQKETSFFQYVNGKNNKLKSQVAFKGNKYCNALLAPSLRRRRRGWTHENGDCTE